jgi:nuclear pore complex protein Nup62
MAEDINKQLDQMEMTLRDLVKKINTAQEQEMDKDNPVYQIMQILNAHLTSLQWIDQTSSQVQQKILDLEKQLKLVKNDQENFMKTRRQSTTFDSSLPSHDEQTTS